MTASRVDANQPAIVEALRKAGAVVIPVNKQRDAGFDVIVVYRHQGIPNIWLVEIKTPGKRNELTPCEKARAEEVNSFGWMYHVITSVEEALQMIGRA